MKSKSSMMSTYYRRKHRKMLTIRKIYNLRHLFWRSKKLNDNNLQKYYKILFSEKKIGKVEATELAEFLPLLKIIFERNCCCESLLLTWNWKLCNCSVWFCRDTKVFCNISWIFLNMWLCCWLLLEPYWWQIVLGTEY